VHEDARQQSHAHMISPRPNHTYVRSHTHTHTHSHTHSHTRAHMRTDARSRPHALRRPRPKFCRMHPRDRVVPRTPSRSVIYRGSRTQRCERRAYRPAGAAGSTSGLRLPRALAAVGSLAVTPGRSVHARGSDAYGPDRAEACSARAWQCGRAGGRGCGRSGNSHLGRCGSFVRSFPVRFVTGALCGRRRTRGVRTNRHAFLRRS
jgi:hypothetical protein